MSVFFDSFGVNWLSLAWYAILFFAVFYLLRRFAFGPVTAMIDKRQADINRALDEAQEAVAAVKRSRERSEEILAEASAHAQEIVRRAERAASEMHEDARREAKVQADAIVAKARTEIERERHAAIAEIRHQVVDLALVAAGTVLRENIDGAKNRALIEQTVAQAELSA
ncbi:MAG: F0F1 ATP synthase subunit B [Candidatus Dormibacteraeota bacterium]|nr:F0F1 ATP synthase subunit B [Candidatus Dormibacteraeota bacterium]